MATGGVVFLHGPGQTEGPLLDEVQQIKTLALVTLGQVDHQAQVGGNHLIFGPLAHAHRALFDVVVAAGLADTTSHSAALMQVHHRLYLAAKHQLLLWCQQLVTTNFTQESTQRAGHDCAFC